MIPSFPKFKSLEITDQEEIEAITSKFLPYSDFNFENMWAWDSNNSAKVSLLNGNLVLLCKSIYNDHMVCTYLGNNKLDNTLYNLYDFLDAAVMLNIKLGLVPEESLKGLDFSKYFIEIDLNSCDYVYDLNKLSNYSGNQYNQKRGRMNSFLRNYPGATVSLLDLNKEENKKQIATLNKSWVDNKVKHQHEIDLELEQLVIQKFLKADFSNTFCVGLYDKEMIGYAIFSFHNQDYVINHFIKADITYKGVYEFLMRQSAILLKARGFKFLNLQEDMGLPGLRRAKATYRPVHFLRKYFVNRL